MGLQVLRNLLKISPMKIITKYRLELTLTVLYLSLFLIIFNLI